MRSQSHSKYWSFLFGFCGLCLSVLVGLLICIHSERLFTQAELRHGQYQLLSMSDADAVAFSRHTIGYLNGRESDWRPSVPFPIPATFTTHMRAFRNAIKAADWCGVFALPVYAIGLSVLLFRAFQKRAFLWGIGLAAGLLLAVLLYAVVDFSGFWLILHRWLIPNGIFSAREPIMLLFPVSLFAEYIPWFLITFTIVALLLTCLPLYLFGRLSRKRRSNP